MWLPRRIKVQVHAVFSLLALVRLGVGGRSMGPHRGSVDVPAASCLGDDRRRRFTVFFVLLFCLSAGLAVLVSESTCDGGDGTW